MNTDELKAIYAQRIKTAHKQATYTRKLIYRIGTAKLLLFVVSIIGCISIWEFGWIYITSILILTALPFAALAKYQDRLFQRKKQEETYAQVNEQELSAMNYDDSNFNDGKEFINPAHLYTFDLDIFGKKSLFQHLNRTCTPAGKQLLADWLNQHSTNKKEIEYRQKAVCELAAELEFRQVFRIIGLLNQRPSTDQTEIEEWVNEPNNFYGKKLFQTAIWVIPGINLLFFVLSICEIVSLNLLGSSFVLFFLTNLSLQKKINILQNTYDKKLGILSTYARLMSLVQKQHWQSDLLVEIHRDLHQAPNAVKRLNKLLDELNQRGNFLISTILNGLFFWEIRKVMHIEQWRSLHAKELLGWIQAIGRTDALNSLATFCYNNPDYTFPHIQTSSFILSTVEMGHPLMPRNQCVKNGINIRGKSHFIVITGANMAGKSTYLRTIGSNYLLACIGAPVCCKHMEIYPSQLITSLRTTDSLSENESYFFAELKRLKLIIEKLQQGKELFIMLDEILKGTNSIDKQKGSLSLIKQLLHLKANGIIATHDLLMGTLAEKYPNQIQNFRFEADINNNELTFSYKIQEGIAQNMNACFLMEKMGIVMDNKETD